MIDLIPFTIGKREKNLVYKRRQMLGFLLRAFILFIDCT